MGGFARLSSLELSPLIQAGALVAIGISSILGLYLTAPVGRHQVQKMTMLGAIGIGVAHTFIIEPHYPIFFTMLVTMEKPLAILALGSFVSGILLGLTALRVVMVKLSRSKIEPRLRLVRTSSGAFMIAMGLIRLAGVVF